MNRALGLFAIGLVFGGGIGFTLAAGNRITFDGHGHSTGLGGGAHDKAHTTALEVPALDAPEIALELIRDPVEGYNLRVQATNFTFTPQAAGLEDVAGEGHAHVYINGKKLGRLYGEWMHIAHLPQGDVIVEVTLNSNTHRPLTVAGQPIATDTALFVE